MAAELTKVLTTYKAQKIPRVLHPKLSSVSLFQPSLEIHNNT